MKVLVLDNYDSFTYNLVHYLEGEGAEVVVHRNNEISLMEINEFQNIVLSPGPGLPKHAGILIDVLKEFHTSKKILGVCLGLQAIGLHYGEELYNLNEVFHGVATNVNRVGDHYIMNDLPLQFEVGRYHSWAIKQRFQLNLNVLAVDEEGTIMAAAHPTDNVCGVQFHPESIMTPVGRQIIKNWLS